MELSPTTDLIHALEGELVHIKTFDEYEMLDRYNVKEAGTLYMLNNRCSVKATNISSIQWINDHKDHDKDKTYYGLKESTKEH